MKNAMKNLLQILFVLVLLGSCISPDKKQSLEQERHIDTAATIPSIFYINKLEEYEKKNIDIHAIATQVDYIALETPENGLIPKSDTRVESISIAGDNIFIVSLNKVFRFSRSGKFLNTIGAMGNGPQEYVTLIDVVINRNKEEVIFYDGGRQALIVYKYDGTFVRSVSLTSSWGIRVGIINDSTLCAVSVPSQSTPGFFLLSLKDGRMIKALSPVYSSRSGIKSLILGFMSSPRVNDGRVFFNSMISDTIFSIDEIALEPRYIQLPPNVRVKDRDPENCSNPHLIFETDFYANIIIFGDTPPAKSYLIDKRENLIYRGGLRDELCGARLIQLINTGEKNEVATLYQAYWLKEQLDSGALVGDTLKYIAQNMKEDDNPVVMIAKLP